MLGLRVQCLASAEQALSIEQSTTGPEAYLAGMTAVSRHLHSARYANAGEAGHSS